MISLQQIEQDLIGAMKAKDPVSVDVLRGLKTRVQNEQTKSSSTGKELAEDDLIALVRSEVKKRKEAAEAFQKGGRTEMSEKELKEAEVLQKYLPAQMGEADLSKIIDGVIAENGFLPADFGKAMGAVKAKVGNAADGAMLAKLLKEKLK